MIFIPYIPAEKFFRQNHYGAGHNVVEGIEAGTPSKEGVRPLSMKVLKCAPCNARLSFPLIQGIYWDPFRETG